MVELLQEQYALLQRSRKIVLDFVESTLGDEELNLPVAAYDGKSIRYLLEHCASCYFGWLAYFTLQDPPGSLQDQSFATVPLLRQLYARVDATVAHFLETFQGKLHLPITGTHDACGRLSATPAQLFTHVLTHEFHHKGQVLSMCRILGHVPPDTDVSAFFPPAG